MRAIASDNGGMGWSGVEGETVDGVGNGTSTGSTYMGNGGCVAGIGIGRMGAGIGTGAVRGGGGGGWEKKNIGLGL
jgi:hypothetical protein